MRAGKCPAREHIEAGEPVATGAAISGASYRRRCGTPQPATQTDRHYRGSYLALASIIGRALVLDLTIRAGQRNLSLVPTWQGTTPAQRRVAARLVNAGARSPRARFARAPPTALDRAHVRPRAPTCAERELVQADDDAAKLEEQREAGMQSACHTDRDPPNARSLGCIRHACDR